MFRTAVLHNAPHPKQGFSEPYMGTQVGQMLGVVGGMMQDPVQHIPGDPAKYGDRVVDFVDGTGMCEGLKHDRILLGRDAIKLYRAKLKVLTQDCEASSEIATTTDYEGHTGAGVAVLDSF